jgi:subtilisin family serine protease
MISRLAKLAALGVILALAQLVGAAEPDGVIPADAAGTSAEAASEESQDAADLPYPRDPFFHSRGTWGQAEADQWALQALGVYGADNTRVSPTSVLPVIVAVIDTGLDLTHPDIDPASLWRNPKEVANRSDDDGNGFVDDLVGWNFVDDDNLPWDHSGHGTHIAGIIAAATDNGVGIAGIAPMARIMPLKVGNFAGNASSPAIAAAAHYAVDHGARIINLSLGGKVVTQAERDAIAYALNHQVLVVTAAGNQATDVSGYGYGGLPGVLTIAAAGPDNTRASFSNYGTQVSLVAPGVDILSLRARATDFILQSNAADYAPEEAVVNDHYYRASGTSFAAAVVSGVAARLLALRPQLVGEKLNRVLIQSATDLATPGFDQATGYGLVNFTSALAQDPDSYILARLDHITMSYRDQAAWLEVYGAADASQLSGASISAIAADGATTELASAIPEDPDSGLLAAINFETLLKSGPRPWLLRLTVQDGSGSSRSADMSVSPPPTAPPLEVPDE